jgi:hypothetical protein
MLERHGIKTTTEHLAVSRHRYTEGVRLGYSMMMVVDVLWLLKGFDLSGG